MSDGNVAGEAAKFLGHLPAFGKRGIIAVIGEREDTVGRVVDRDFVASLPAGTDPNGENGEYHTFCYDGPIFASPVPFRLGTPFRRSYDVRLDDGTSKSYAYWFADLREA